MRAVGCADDGRRLGRVLAAGAARGARVAHTAPSARASPAPMGMMVGMMVGMEAPAAAAEAELPSELLDQVCVEFLADLDGSAGAVWSTLAMMEWVAAHDTSPPTHREPPLRSGFLFGGWVPSCSASSSGGDCRGPADP